MSNTTVHPYDKHPFVYNFFFHPLHSKNKGLTAASIITQIFLTALTGGLWLVPFLIVNDLDSKKIRVWKKEHENAAKTSEVAEGKLSKPKSATDPKKIALTPEQEKMYQEICLKAAEKGKTPYWGVFINIINKPLDANLMAILRCLFQNEIELEKDDPEHQFLEIALEQALKAYIYEDLDPNIYLAIAKFLLDQGYSLEKMDPKGELFKKALSSALGDPLKAEVAEFFINNGANLETADPNGLTCLKAAIEEAIVKPGYGLNFAQFLVSKGVKVEKADPRRSLLQRAIHHALASSLEDESFLAKLEFLIQNGAKLDSNGSKSLYQKYMGLAIKKTTSDPSNKKVYDRIIEVLQENGIEPINFLSQKEKQIYEKLCTKAAATGKMPLFVCIQKALSNPDVPEYMAIVESLFEAGAKLEDADPQGELLKKTLQSAIFDVVNLDYYLIIAQVLIGKGAKLEVADPAYKILKDVLNRAIQHPTEQKYMIIAKYLFEKGAKLEVADSQGEMLNYALNRAILDQHQSNYMTIAKFLFEKGAKLEVADPHGALLKTVFAKAIQTATDSQEYMTIANVFFDHGAQLKEADPNGELLCFAAIHLKSNPHVEGIAKMLVEKGSVISPGAKLLLEASPSLKEKLLG